MLLSVSRYGSISTRHINHMPYCRDIRGPLEDESRSNTDVVLA